MKDTTVKTYAYFGVITESAIERFFSKPLELMRAMAGERHTVSVELLRRNDLA